MLSWRALVLLALLAQGWATPLPPAPAPVSAPKEGEIYRLPSEHRIVPSHYDITIKPQYVNGRLNGIEAFDGRVEISATVAVGTKQIYLNCAKDIEIISVNITKLSGGGTDAPATGSSEPTTAESSGPSETRNQFVDDAAQREEGSTPAGTGSTPDGTGSTPDGTGSTPDGNEEEEPLSHEKPDRPDRDMLRIPMTAPIPKGTNIRIEISYSRNFIEGELDGFYVSTYLDENNNETTLLLSQFQWTYARKAFPSFDEPEFKATFQLSIAVTDKVTAISNTNSIDNGNASFVTFEITPKMSTYLLAFVVYEKASFSYLDDGEHEFRTFGRIEALAEGKGVLSQDDGPAMLDILKNYTQISYYGDKDDEQSMGMTKMDQVAITDLTPAGMENWGLITYRENAFFVKENGSEATKKRVSEVIAHELAHQWFGNWVTTKWWNTIWLNEAFANFFENEVMHRRYGDWKMPERMVLDVQMFAFDADSDASSPPLSLAEDEVNTPEDITLLFGTITYSKGGSILRQIRNVLGEDNFQTAIRAYLQKMRLDSALPQDIFDEFIANNEITDISDDDLQEILDNWTNKAGYPVLTVTKINDTAIRIDQERFLFSTSAANDTEYDVYLTWMTDRDSPSPTAPPPPYGWMRSSEKSKEVSVVGSGAFTWVLLNLYQGGYYRVDYSEELWNALRNALNDRNEMKKISALDRAALVNNALSLVRKRDGSNVKYQDVFSFLLFLKHDTAFEPWAALRYSLGHVSRMMASSPVYKGFINNVVREAYGTVTFDMRDNENHLQKTHRVNVLTVACGGSYGPCLEAAESRLSQYLTQNIAVHQDLESIVYCYGLKKDSASTLWDELWKKYVAARKDMTRRQLIASALGCAKHNDTLFKYLDYSLDSEDIPDSERYLAFSAVYANPDDGPAVAIEFIKNKTVEAVAEAYGENRIASLLTGLAGYLSTDIQKRLLADALNCGECTDSPYKQSLDIVQTNINWRNENDDAITEGLQRAGDASAASLATGLLLLCAAVLRHVR